MTPTQVTEQYFTLSNERRLDDIFKLFADDATYSSDNTGLYFGLESIRQMVKEFFGLFPYLHWEVHGMRATDTHIVEVDFTLSARNADGEEVVKPGIERVVVVNGKIRHVEVRNR